MPLEALPFELLDRICLFIRHDSFQDLSALTLTSHKLFDVAAPVLYRKLIVQFDDEDDNWLAMAVAELTPNGLGRQYLTYARQLDLISHHAVKLDDTGRTTIPASTRNVSLRFTNHHTDTANAEFLDAYLAEPSVPGLELKHWPLAPYTGTGEDREWEPLSTLLKTLKNLIELNYYVKGTLPVWMAEVMAAHHPFCRLHVWGSQCPASMSDSAALTTRTNDSYAVDILKSHYLEAFTLACPLLPEAEDGNADQPFDSDQSNDHGQFNEYFQMLAQVPNLKHLRIIGFTTEEGAVTREVNKDVNVVEKKETPSASLESLSLSSRAIFSAPGLLDKIAGVCSLDNLKSLEIHLTKDAALIAKVAPSLQKLERLAVFWKAESHADAIRDLVTVDAEEDSHIVAAVQAFRPLQYLRIQGLRKVDALRTILTHHGKTLVGLSIDAQEGYNDEELASDEGHRFPVLTSADFTEVAELCPGIEELRLQVQRTMGNAAECAIYKALGKFDNLVTLFLDLQCEPRTPPFNGMARDTPVREIFINSATDEKLAKAIWKLIFSTQSSCKLRNLRLLPFGSSFLDIEVKYILSFVAPTLLVKRRGSGPSETLQITKVGTKEQILLQHNLKCDVYEMERLDQEERGEDWDEEAIWAVDAAEYITAPTKGVVTGLWPGDWRVSWSSFPLSPSDQ